METFAAGINNQSVVVGGYLIAGEPYWPYRAYKWSASGGFVPLPGIPDSFFDIARDINECGVATGQSKNHAVRWLPNEEVEDLGTLSQFEPANRNTSQAYGVNNLGHIVGDSTSPIGDGEAFIWTEETGMVGLGRGEGYRSYAQDINDHDVVTGAIRYNDKQVAAIWNADGELEELPGLGGTDSWGYSIDNQGEVVGVSTLPTGEYRGFIWSRRYGTRDLGLLPDGSYILPRDINERGDIIGDAIIDDASPRRTVVLRRFGPFLFPVYLDTRHSYSTGFAINDHRVLVHNFQFTGFNDTRAEVVSLPHIPWHSRLPSCVAATSP
jgi:probable HAF family extracellular repeat protein